MFVKLEWLLVFYIINQNEVMAQEVFKNLHNISAVYLQDL